MKLKLYYQSQVKEVEVLESMTLKDLFYKHFTSKRPSLIQVGGGLGSFYKGFDIRKTLSELKFYEESILFLDDFCPVDYSRFMLRFVMRELGIVNESLKKLYQLIEDLTNGSSDENTLDILRIRLSKPGKTLGEKLACKNISQLLEWYEDEFESHVKGACSLGICRGLFKAQCINACPAGIHIPGFVALMKDDDYDQAYKLMRQENPLSSVCGSVCARPCEDRCRRGEITGTVGVRALQRFISAKALESWEKETCLDDKGLSVGIIGGGPAGLTAGYFLRRSGYDVTIYEKNAEAGGMLSYGVPKYRLPSVEIQREIKTIEELGVQIKRNFEVGKDAMFDEIRSRHNSVLIATGTPIGKSLESTIDSQAAIDFLRQVHTGDLNSFEGHILVVGGGDVSMDVARSSIRLGAKVSLVSLESENILPASKEECLQSKEEGVNLLHGYGIDRIEDSNVHLKTCLDVYNDGGGFSPVFANSDLVLENVDLIVWAIGQKRDLSFTLMDQPELEGADDIFLAGDVLKPTIVIDAIGQGKKAAESIDAYLGGSGLYTGKPITIPEKVLNIRTFDDDLREIDTLDPIMRIKSFDQVNKNYSLEDAKYEASRCMRCDRNSSASLLLGR
ncbi:hypothetical protein EZV73_11300 [Acidaminobacter sp. JC074]|uniref:FAD-dependent oxidoreductase n=1 Tax=Acidaminobacter sp. JC074 TaxID=2530199 RepID=UPI001F0F437E|nr:FAD-dependent oxidoreductase [Acidaminobacter sp. JC074]MCH4888163.1 hypothetical protein [Acidaminobacter sp. JC074]